MHHSPDAITFIIVNYKSAHELHRCLTDLSQLPCANRHEVIIVNNDSSPLSLPSYGFFAQKCIEINKNLGYGAANNIGLSHASCHFVCFLNPDTHSFSKNLFEITKHISDKTIVSPRIFSEDHTPQKWSTGEKISLLRLLKNNLGFYQKTWEADIISPVHWVSGASLWGKTDFFRSLGGFDESFFLYFEDVDLCERVHKNNGFVYYIPLFSVVHTGGQSTKSTRKNQKRCYYKSQDIFFKKHVGIMPTLILRILRLFHV